MSALAVYLERAGIATVVVGLIRPHLEKIKPPRALFVPFELGRPLGPYIDAGEFQKNVLRAAFSLLDRADGPVILEDYQIEDPSEAGDATWQAPELAAGGSIADEVAALKPTWERAKSRFGRTTAALSGLSIEQAAEFLERFDTDNPALNPNDDMSDLLRMRFCADDLKAFFLEAAMADGDPSSRQVADWFWRNTRVARELQRIRTTSVSKEDAVGALVRGKLLVPGAHVA